MTIHLNTVNNQHVKTLVQLGLKYLDETTTILKSLLTRLRRLKRAHPSRISVERPLDFMVDTERYSVGDHPLESLKYAAIASSYGIRNSKVKTTDQ